MKYSIPGLFIVRHPCSLYRILSVSSMIPLKEERKRKGRTSQVEAVMRSSIEMSRVYGR